MMVEGTSSHKHAASGTTLSAKALVVYLAQSMQKRGKAVKLLKANSES